MSTLFERVFDTLKEELPYLSDARAAHIAYHATRRRRNSGGNMSRRVPSVGEIVKSSYELQGGQSKETIDYTIEDVIDPELGPIDAHSGRDFWEVYVDDAEGKLRRIHWSKSHDSWVEEGAFDA